jgi:hypothetical protein
MGNLGEKNGWEAYIGIKITIQGLDCTFFMIRASTWHFHISEFPYSLSRFYDKNLKF